MERRPKSCRAWAILPLLLLLGLGTVAGAEDVDKYSPEELEEIVAPIALFPDIVLSSVLPASTNPTDVVRAARWVEAQESEITEPPEDSGWDPAVEAMLQFPDVLVWMNENLDWMEMLAFAVAVQEGQVLDAIQDFRAKVEDVGNLQTNEKVQIIQEGDTIVIQPAQPTIVFVPRYHPVAVRRTGWVWGPSSWGVGFAMGALGAWAWHGVLWGGGWGRGSIHVNRSPQFNFNNNGMINRGNIRSGNRWSANNRPNRRPSQRPRDTRPRSPGNRPGNRPRPGAGGVRPGNARPGGRPSRPGGAPSRPGRPGGGVRPTPPPSAPGGGNRPGGGAGRPSSGNRPGGGAQRPGGGNRPIGGAQRPSRAPNRSNGNRSMLGGSSSNGRSTQRTSNRGRASASGGRARGTARSGGSDRARGGGARGGGGSRRR